MPWIVFRLTIWLVGFTVALFVLEPTDIQGVVIAGLIAFAITYGGTIATSIWNYIRSLGARIEMRWTQESHRRPIARGRKIVIEDLKLLIESGDPANPIINIGVLVNPETDYAIRPYLIMKVKDKKLVGRQLEIRFEMLSPRDSVKYKKTLVIKLKYGENRITPRASLVIPNRFAKGTWTIRVLAGNRILETKEFRVTNVTLATIARQMDGDMQGDSSTRNDAEKLENIRPEDVLGDMLE